MNEKVKSKARKGLKRASDCRSLGGEFEQISEFLVSPCLFFFPRRRRRGGERGEEEGEERRRERRGERVPKCSHANPRGGRGWWHHLPPYQRLCNLHWQCRHGSRLFKPPLQRKPRVQIQHHESPCKRSVTPSQQHSTHNAARNLKQQQWRTVKGKYSACVTTCQHLCRFT